MEPTGFHYFYALESSQQPLITQQLMRFADITIPAVDGVPCFFSRAVIPYLYGSAIGGGYRQQHIGLSKTIPASPENIITPVDVPRYRVPNAQPAPFIGELVTIAPMIKIGIASHIICIAGIPGNRHNFPGSRQPVIDRAAWNKGVAG